MDFIQINKSEMKIGIKDNWVYLKSYKTIIAAYNMRTHKMHRLWDDWSVTSSTHYNKFRKMLNNPDIPKWSAMNAEKIGDVVPKI